MYSPNVSEDDDSFEPMEFDFQELSNAEIINISSNEDTESYFTSEDENELPSVDLTSKKSALINNLFPTSTVQVKTTNNSTKYAIPSVDLTSKKSAVIKNLFPTSTVQVKTTNNSTKYAPSTSNVNRVAATSLPKIPKAPGFEKMIGGVKVHLPVDPYGSQTLLMFKIITAIKKGQNCLLESPTGSGKTLALLCGALAWQQQERCRIAQISAQQSLSTHPELSGVAGAGEYIASPAKGGHDSREIFFAKAGHGARTIYDKPLQDCTDDAASGNKRQEPLQDCPEDSPLGAQVTIHKKRRLNTSDLGESSQATSPKCPVTPEKPINVTQPETPENVRNLYNLMRNLQLRTTMLVSCSLPTIYYGARTHKQLQQVVKEFSRTWYCGDAPMTILSSRDYSCIREFDKQMWGTKNDMCRGCTKRIRPKEGTPKKEQTNCVFYDNRQALHHEVLPPAFDLEDLVAAGEELKACPYFAARAMAPAASIVFCPYNYLIEPSIRKSMQIDLRNNILIIDEAHNIEDICRDAATFSFSRDNMKAAFTELEVVSSYRYASSDSIRYLDRLMRALRSWDDWFGNQVPLVANKPINNNEAVHTWDIDHFVQTLDNHNIGQQHYNDFTQGAEIFLRHLREQPESLFGVTQATGTLIESVDTVLGYLFRDSGRYKNDFKPALIRTVYCNVDSLSESKSWRNSQFAQRIDKDTLSLRLMCMNPAVVFEGLKTAKCIILASGTLTPLVSLHSELGTEFPLQVSPNHIIPNDRVWVGTLTTCPDGQRLECTSRGTDQAAVQDALGEAVMWVTQVTPHGVLCFLPSYMLMNKLYKRWQESGLWRKLNDLKHVFMEKRNVRDHNDIMEDYYKYVTTDRGALLFAVYRGKVSEGMDFKDHQARAVVTIGVPYPNTFDMAVKEKMSYNDKCTADRKLLSSREWLRVQAYRALNQAVGRCVRHRGDWGAVLLVDARFAQPYYTEHLSKWVRNFLGNNHHTYESLINSPNSLESFMQNMTIRDNEDV